MIDPILLDIPDHLETPRLLVRCPRAGDGPALFEAVNESRAELIPWLPWARKDHQVVDDSELRVRHVQADFILRKSLNFHLYLKQNNLLVGGIGLHPQDWQVPSFEIGYWQRTAYSGNGYMTEAVNGLTQFVRDDLHACRIIIRCDALNLKSRAVAERAGFIYESVMRSQGRNADNELRDLLVFSKTWPD